MEVIHAVGVVHRDLKPSNVLLADDGPRIIDFGISHAANASGLTRTGWVTGSPGFMSPEQADGRPAGPASDIFSLGRDRHLIRDRGLDDLPGPRRVLDQDPARLGHPHQDRNRGHLHRDASRFRRARRLDHAPQARCAR